MRLKALIFALVFVVAGCTIKTQIIEPDGSVYTIKSGSGSLVMVNRADWQVTVDNKAPPNIFESLLGWLLLKTPEAVQAK